MRTIKLELVALYYRVSTDEQETVNQVAQLKEYCTKNKYVYDLYGDPGETGTNFSNRKDFIRLMGECGLDYSIEYNSFKINLLKPVKYHKIICKSSSRFGRAVETIPLLELLYKNNIEVVFLEDGQSNRDILDPNNNLMLGLNSLINKQYSLQTSQRVKNGMTQSAKRGNILVNPYIFGYDYNQQENKLYKNKDSKYVELIFTLYSQDVGMRKIAKILNQQNILTARGNKWVAEGIRTILNNAKYCGTNVRNKYSKSKITRDTHVTTNDISNWIVHEDSDKIEPIITKELFNRCQELIDQNKSGRRGLHRGDNILVGKIKCTCGANYIINTYNTKDGKKIYYVCGNKKYYGVKMCDNPNITEDTLKSIVTNDYIGGCIFRYKNILLNSLRGHKSELYAKLSNYSPEEVKKLQDGINKLRGQISKLLNIYLENEIDKELYMAKKQELEDKLNRAIYDYNLVVNPKENIKTELDILDKKIQRVKALNINFKYTWEEIKHVIKEIQVYKDRSITITLCIDELEFKDDIHYNF